MRVSVSLAQWTLATILIAVSFGVALTFALPAEADDEAPTDLRSLVITDGQAASGGLEFRRSYDNAFDPREAMAPGARLDLQRLSDNVLQGWDTFFRSLDGDVELHIRLIEFANNHWASSFRTKATEPTPDGFPEDARVFSDENGTMATSVVRGRMQAIVYVQRPDTDHPLIDRRVAEAILRHTVSEQLNRLPELPDLDSSTRIQMSDIRAVIIGLQVVAIPIIALWLMTWATLRDFGTLERFFPAQRRPHGVTFYDLSPAARTVRRKALRRSLLQLTVATAVGVVVLMLELLSKADALVELAFLPMALAVMIVVDVFVSSRKASGLPFQKESRFPLIVGTLGGMAVVYAAAFMVFTAIALVALFNPGSWIVKMFMVAIFAVLGVRLLKYVARPMRFAKQLVARGVAETLANDPRQEIVMLRSFQDDGLMMRMHRSARHNPVELASAQPFERFEELLAWSLWRFGPVVAIGQPTTEGHLPPLGAAREFFSDDDWQDAVRKRMASSSAIVFVVGRSPGLWWEVTNARRLGFIDKCLFVFPPVDYVELADRLCVLSAALGLDQESLPTVDSEGHRLIGMYFDDSGSPVTVGVDGRDDLAYQTLFESVAPRLIGRTHHVRVADAEVAAEPSPEVASIMARFEPEKSYSSAPGPWQGLLYIAWALTHRNVTRVGLDTPVPSNN